MLKYVSPSSRTKPISDDLYLSKSTTPLFEQDNCTGKFFASFRTRHRLNFSYQVSARMGSNVKATFHRIAADVLGVRLTNAYLLGLGAVLKTARLGTIETTTSELAARADHWGSSLSDRSKVSTDRIEPRIQLDQSEKSANSISTLSDSEVAVLNDGVDSADSSISNLFVQKSTSVTESLSASLSERSPATDREADERQSSIDCVKRRQSIDNNQLSEDEQIFLACLCCNVFRWR